MLVFEDALREIMIVLNHDWQIRVCHCIPRCLNCGYGCYFVGIHPRGGGVRRNFVSRCDRAVGMCRGGATPSPIGYWICGWDELSGY